MIITEGNTGHSHINKDTVGNGKVQMKKLDTLGFNFDRIDYIKIDCEGYEMPIIQGGENTIKHHMPVIVVEQKLHTDTGITKETQYGCVELLKSWGLQQTNLYQLLLVSLLHKQYEHNRSCCDRD